MSAITIEQRARDNHRLARTIFRTDRIGDATHAHGVNLNDDTLTTRKTPTKLLFLARPRKASLRELARDIFADIRYRMEHEDMMKGGALTWL